jgi:hypothetical protein
MASLSNTLSREATTVGSFTVSSAVKYQKNTTIFHGFAFLVAKPYLVEEARADRYTPTMPTSAARFSSQYCIVGVDIRVLTVLMPDAECPLSSSIHRGDSTVLTTVLHAYGRTPP